MQRVSNHSDYVFVDLDTGTVLGSNVVAVNIRELSDSDLEMLEFGNDADACDVGTRFGNPLHTLDPIDYLGSLSDDDLPF